MKPKFTDQLRWARSSYVPASRTDIRVTFERIRREIELAKKVVPLRGPSGPRQGDDK